MCRATGSVVPTVALRLRFRDVPRVGIGSPPCRARRGDGRKPDGWLLAGRIRRWGVLFRRAILRIPGRPGAERAHRGYGRHARKVMGTTSSARTAACSRSGPPSSAARCRVIPSTHRWSASPSPRKPGLLPRGLRRRGVRLRRRPLPRIDGRPEDQPAHRWYLLDDSTSGYWLSPTTAGCSPSTPPSSGPLEDSASMRRSSACHLTRATRGTTLLVPTEVSSHSDPRRSSARWGEHASMHPSSDRQPSARSTAPPSPRLLQEWC